jgi:hypothetical protein
MDSSGVLCVGGVCGGCVWGCGVGDGLCGDWGDFELPKLGAGCGINRIRCHLSTPLTKQYIYTHIYIYIYIYDFKPLISDTKQNRTTKTHKHVTPYCNNGTTLSGYILIEGSTETGKGKYWSMYV